MFIKRKTKKNIYIKIILAAAGILLTTLFIFFAFYRINKPPVSAFIKMDTAVNQARKTGSDRYTPLHWQKLIADQTKARRSWDAENLKPVFLRNYRDALLMADQTVIDAINLTLLVHAKSDSIKNSLTIGIPYLKNILRDYKNRFSHLPVSKSSQHETITGELLLLESEYAAERGDYILASKKMNQAAGKIENAKSTISGIITEYLAGMPVWQKWVEEALTESRKEKATLIVIEKLEHFCTVYTSGKLSDQYKIELGPNWIGPKSFSGDKATPEGIYRIIKKKLPPQTKYYKALELNYPNDTDRQRFESGIKNGTLPAFSQIGGLIEIHGGGGQGFNWTDGCIALNNSDMDKMYNSVETNAKVIIVGSLKLQHHLLYDPYLSK